jgi:glycosyltransferase involved in cell wall biosynthesis
MSPPVRILIDYRPALRERTGVGEYTHELAGAVARSLPLADTLTLFSSSWKDRLAPDAIPGTPVVDARVPVSLLNFAWHRLELPPVEWFAGPVDVAHSMHPLLLPSRRAAQVVTIHDLYFLDRGSTTQAEIRRDYADLARAHAHRADAVVAVSKYTASQIAARLDIPRASISISSPAAPRWRPNDRYEARGPILFMGTIEPRKNVGLLLDAYERLLASLPDAPALTLAGKLTPACEPLAARLAKPPLAGRATHLGYVSGGHREELFRSASMLVLPSVDEGFGMPALEAMATGIPAVVSNRGALPEIAGDAGLYVEPDDAAGLAEAMSRVLKEPALASRMIATGLERARLFTWEASAANVRRAYESAIERRRARR